MLFNQGAHITKGVIQWGPAKKKREREREKKERNVKFEIVKISLKNTIFKCSIKITG